MCHKTGNCDFRLYKNKTSGKYLVWVAPFNHIITEPNIEHIKWVGGFEFGKDEYYAGSVLMSIIENVEQYFTDINYDGTPPWCNGDDIRTFEAKDVVSEISSHDR